MSKPSFSTASLTAKPSWFILVPLLVFHLICFGINYLIEVKIKSQKKIKSLKTGPVLKNDISNSTTLFFGLLLISLTTLGATFINFLSYRPTTTLPNSVIKRQLPTNPSAKLNLADQKLVSVPEKEYQTQLEKQLLILKKQPSHFALLINIAAIYAQQNQITEAQKYYNLAKQVDPNSPVFPI